MKDVCIKLLSKHPVWTNYYDVEIDTYKSWVRKNMREDAYHIPKGKEPLIFFLGEEDLIIFTLQFGRECYQVMENFIDMSKVERMIWNEIVQERLNEKSHY